MRIYTFLALSFFTLVGIGALIMQLYHFIIIAQYEYIVIYEPDVFILLIEMSVCISALCAGIYALVYYLKEVSKENE